MLSIFGNWSACIIHQLKAGRIFYNKNVAKVEMFLSFSKMSSVKLRDNRLINWARFNTKAHFTGDFIRKGGEQIAAFLTKTGYCTCEHNVGLAFCPLLTVNFPF